MARPERNSSLELFVSLREQGCEEITHIINKAVSENVKTARCVLNLVVEVSVLESKGHDRPRSYAKSSNYLSGFANAMIPISHTTQCPYKSSGTLLYEHQVGASAFRDYDPTTQITSPPLLLIPDFRGPKKLTVMSLPKGRLYGGQPCVSVAGDLTVLKLLIKSRKASWR